MKTAFSRDLWRQHLWFWLGPLLLVAVNLTALVVYRQTFAGRVDQLEVAYEEDQARLRQVRSQRQQIGERVATAEQTRDAVQSLYRDTFGTERSRLTEMIREVKAHAYTAGFEVTRISYPEEQLEDYDLVRLAFVFTVEGSYANLRRFINALELADSFITLEQIQLREREGGLAVNLQLSTLFAEPDAEPLSENGIAGGTAGGSR
jgi:Tfp pilus assembly protein PilO